MLDILRKSRDPYRSYHILSIIKLLPIQENKNVLENILQWISKSENDPSEYSHFDEQTIEQATFVLRSVGGDRVKFELLEMMSNSKNHWFAREIASKIILMGFVEGHLKRSYQNLCKFIT